MSESTAKFCFEVNTSMEQHVSATFKESSSTGNGAQDEPQLR